MRLTINPDGWSFSLLDTEWSWASTPEGNIVMNANGYPIASIRSVPINTYEHVESGFSLSIDGNIVYRDMSRDSGFLIFTSEINGICTSISLIKDYNYDPVSDLDERMSML
jgi:hypothetical protein